MHSYKVLMNRNQKCSNNNAFKEWGYFDANDKMKIFKIKVLILGAEKTRQVQVMSMHQ